MKSQISKINKQQTAVTSNIARLQQLNTINSKNKIIEEIFKCPIILHAINLDIITVLYNICKIFKI